MLVTITSTLRTDSGEVIDVFRTRAYILLCQDAENEYLAVYGTVQQIDELLVWGAANWPMLPQCAEVIAAIDNVLKPRIRQEKTSPHAWSVPMNAPNEHPDDVTPILWTMDFVMRREDHTLSRKGMTDALLFVINEEGEKRHATGGSGIQKGKLVEMGIKEIFGAHVLQEFNDAIYGDEPPFLRLAREQARAQGRQRDPSGPGIGTITVVVPEDPEDKKK